MAGGCGGFSGRIAGIKDTLVGGLGAVEGSLGASERLSFNAGVDGETRILGYARNSGLGANWGTINNGARYGGACRTGTCGGGDASTVDTGDGEARIVIHAFGSFSTTSNFLGILSADHARICRSRAIRWS